MSPTEGAEQADYATARALFDSLVELAEEERGVRLAASTVSPAIRGLVGRWLAADANGLTSPLTGALGARIDLPQPGSRFGRWRVIEAIGRGGMGAVLRVERDDGAYQQQAALKLVGTRLSHEAISRFQAERQILAALNHPHIARLIDGGAEGDLPWLVMELVEGRNLIEHCEDHSLDLRARLRLFLDLCGAVAYSHRSLVLHRDIKPGNVRVDRDGRVVLLDFGVASLLSAAQPVRAGTPEPLTPAFAAPEQQRGEPVGTAADLYSLGRVLEEMARGENGGDRLLRDDIARIVQRALQPDPAARYSTAEALSADCRRALERRVVHAGNTRLSQRMAKAVLRNPWQTAFILTLGSAMLAGTLGAIHAALRISGERDRALAAEANAQEEAATADATTQFLIELLGSAAPSVQRGEELKVTELLDSASERLLSDTALPDGVRARVAHRLSLVQSELGRFDEATRLSEQAIAWLGQEPTRDRLEARLQWAYALRSSGQPDDLSTFHDEMLAEIRRQWPGDRALLAGTLNKAAVYHMESGNYDSADRYLSEAIKLWEAISPQQPSLATGYFNLGVIASYRGDHHEAASFLREAVRRDEVASGPMHPDVISSLSLLSSVEVQSGNYEAALVTTSTVVERSERVYPDGNWQLSRAMGNRGLALQRLGRVEDALAIMTASTQGKHAVGGPPQQLFSRRVAHARMLAATGQFDSAQEVLQQALAEPPPNQSPVVKQWVLRAEILASFWNGRNEDAAHSLQRLIDLYLRREEVEAAGTAQAELATLRCMAGDRSQPEMLTSMPARLQVAALNLRVMELRTQVACNRPGAPEAIRTTLQLLAPVADREVLIGAQLRWLLAVSESDDSAISSARSAYEDLIGVTLPKELQPFDPRITL